MGKIRIGVSGWSYDGWDGAFYPRDLPASRRLGYVATRFETVEINGTFYSLRRPADFEGWAAAVPANFVFAVKGSRFITHNKKLRDATTPLANFLAQGLLRLGGRLGPILWQLPGTLELSIDRLDAFLSALPPDTDAASRLARRHDRRVSGRSALHADANHRLRHVLEPRHPSFFRAPVVRSARRHGVALAFSDSPDWPYTEEVTAGFVYLRLHGSRKLYASRYTDAELDRLAARIRCWHRGEEPADAVRITDRQPPRRKTRDVYVYFDNDQQANAPGDALRLAERLGLESARTSRRRH